MGPTPRGNPVVPTPDQLLSDDLFRLAIESSPNGVAIVAPAGSIVMANARLEWEFGYEHDELIGQHIEGLVPESLRSVHGTGPIRQFDSGRDPTDRCPRGVRPP